MLGLCEQCIGDSLNSRQKSIIDRCVRKLYIDIARSREKYIPVMSDFYGLLLDQLRFVTNTSSGMGLIKCGSVVIPFDNQISKDTDLYRLYNTNIHEKIEEEKRKKGR